MPRRLLRPALAALAAAALAAAGCAAPPPTVPAPVPPIGATPVLPPGGEVTYVVRTVPGTDTGDVAAGAGADVERVYTSAVTGFAAGMSAEEARALAADPRVLEVVPDQPVYATGEQVPAPSWGLDRLDQRDLPLSGAYRYPDGGAQVAAYVVDTGVVRAHQDFAGRVSAAYFDALGGTGEDCNGHGTHVAGTVAGSRFGVSKNALVVPVRVLGCDGAGSMSSVIAGLDWAVAHHTGGPAVLNMSLGGGAYSPLDAAVDRAVADGITVVVAAGNSNADACTQSPSRAASAVTVGATTRSDARASFSNWGGCVDLFAPGDQITSAWYTSTTATATLSGTSMASPHVAGVAARYLSANAGATPAQVAAALVGGATRGKVTSPGTGSPDALLYAEPASAPAPAPTPVAPTAPGRPALVVGDRALTATWVAADGRGWPITSYTVTTRRAADGVVATTVQVTGTTARVGGLVNGTAYVVTVTATSGGGVSPASPASAPATPAAVPTAPVAPQVKLSGRVAKVAWVAPAANGSAVTGYELAVSAGGPTLVLGTVRTTSATVALPPGRWTFTVRARNAVGASAWSPASAPVNMTRS